MAQSKSSSPYSITGLHSYPWIRWWYFLAAPAAPAGVEELPLQVREFLRRGKLTSIALLIELIELIIQVVASSRDGTNSQFAILISIGFIIIAIMLNRAGKLLLASLLIMVVLEVGMVAVLALPPGTKLGLPQIPFIFLLAQPLLVSVLLFPAWGILVVGAMNMIVTCVMLIFLPKTADFQVYFQAHAAPLFGIPLTIQLLAALISFIVITSLQESLVRADKAEEITKLQQMMAEQAHQELQTKRQLEAGIQEVVTGLTRFSNGDQQARIQLEQGHFLLPVAGNINNMISRFTRLQAQERPLEQTMQALRAYIKEVQFARVTGASLPVPHTGTEVDTLVKEMYAYLSSAQRAQRDTHPPNRPSV